MKGITIIKIKQSIINFFVAICAILLFSQSAQAEGEPSENFKRHQQYVQDNNIATKLYNSPDEFFKAVIPENKTGETDEYYLLVNYMGYSGAGYKTEPIEGESLSSYEKFKQDFKASVERHYTQALNSDGVMVTKLIFILGGTKDGFGEGYEWIKEFKEEQQQQGKDISKIIVAGMVSDQAESGDISPDQDYLLLVDSYKDESGQSWELKEAKDKTSIIIDLFNHSQIVYVELFGGGAQAEKEISEWLKHQSDTGTKQLLYPDYQSQTKRKDYNAAKQLLANPEIKNEDEKDTTESTNSPIYIRVHTTGSSSLVFIGQYLEQSSPTTVSDAMSASES